MTHLELLYHGHYSVYYYILCTFTVVVLQRIIYIFLWAVKFVFRYLAANVFITNISSVIVWTQLKQVTWEMRLHWLCFWEGGKNKDQLLHPRVWCWGWQSSQKCQYLVLGLWYDFSYSLLAALCNSYLGACMTWGEAEAKESLVQSEGVLTWTHWVVAMLGIFHIPFKGG